MEFLREFLSKLRTVMDEGQKRMDRWMVRNPIAFFHRMQFVNNQRRLYSPRYAKLWTLGKWGLAGYFTASLFTFELNQPIRQDRKFLTEYYVLANLIEYDRLEQFGMEPHLSKLYQRGLKRGLTQIELLELVKLHEANEPTADLASHVEYLRELKS